MLAPARCVAVTSPGTRRLLALAGVLVIASVTGCVSAASGPSSSFPTGNPSSTPDGGNLGYVVVDGGYVTTTAATGASTDGAVTNAPYGATDAGEGGGKGMQGSDPAPAPTPANGYEPTTAAQYADGHWSDGVGECAEFVSRSLQEGGLSIDLITWVPTLVSALSSTSYTEYDPTAPTAVGGQVGDVVVYSNDTGNQFCVSSNPSDFNCGHVGIITVAGTDMNSTLLDFHNNPHYRYALGSILGSTTVGPSEGAYSTYRVYHLSN